MTKLKITQLRSRCGASDRQRKNLDALGLRKINMSVEHSASPMILGMIEKVKHLIKIEEVK
ncbi:MAG: 50S ribosomal protein L30 [Rikenellaceae bacterium]